MVTIERKQLRILLSGKEWAELRDTAALDNGLLVAQYAAQRLSEVPDNYEHWITESAGIAQRYVERAQAGREAIAIRRFGITTPEDIAMLTALWVATPSRMPRSAPGSSRQGRYSAGGTKGSAEGRRGRQVKIWMDASTVVAIEGISKRLADMPRSEIGRRAVLGLPLFAAEKHIAEATAERQAKAIIAEAERIARAKNIV